MSFKQNEASTRRMNDKKRKREEAAGGNSAPDADQQKPKRVKNKEKYLPKGNKARKRAAAQLMNGANAIPVQERVRDGSVAEDAAPDAATENEAGSKPTGEDFFVIDTTPMDPAEVEKKKSTGQGKRERQATEEAENHSAERKADKEARKEKKRKEAREREERNDKKNAQKSQEKKEKKQKNKEVKQQAESRKTTERQAQEDTMDENEKDKEAETSSSDSDSSSSSGSDNEVEVKKTVTPKAADRKPEKKENPAAKEAKHEEQATNKNRFIVFVGNLPYTATTETVTAHFSKIAPISVRVATDKKDSNKCRGFGFVEFEAFDRMQTCLKLYHHSSFDDGKSPARKINVELTAGGGGKSKTRRTKLKEKNQKLAEERAKNAQEEKKKKGGKESKEEGGEFSGIHPSRLNQMR